MLGTGKKQNEINFSMLERNRFGENLTFGRPSEPLHFKKISDRELEKFKLQLHEKRMRRVLHKSIAFVFLSIGLLYLGYALFF